MFGISGTELALIVVFILIIFGPDKLPELARTIGKAMRMFKSAQEDMERIIKAEIVPSETSTTSQSGPTKAAATSQASAIWEETESDDEEEEEEE